VIGPSQTGKTQRQWRECTTFLASVPLPLDLQRLVQWQQLREIFDGPHISQLTQRSWQTITTVPQLVHLQNWLRLGVQVPYALCECTPSEATFNPMATALVPADLVALQHALQQPSATLALQLRGSNGTSHAWSVGELVITRDDGEYEFRIRSRQRLRVCPECRAVLPAEQYSDHKSISVVDHVCTQDRQIASVESPKVYLVTLFDMCQVLRLFAQTVRALVNGYHSDLHETIHTWLEEAVFPLYETSGNSNDQTWLLGLCQAIDVFLAIIHDNSTTDVASHDVRDVLKYKDVIDALLRHIQEW
jgi:hypothetical protein